MMKLGQAGSTLVLNVLAVSIFAILAGVVYVAAKSQVKTAVYVLRQAQAQALAEAGLEDALHSLRSDSSWRTGFSNKSFAEGTYTVRLTTASPPLVTSTGYSKTIFGLGAAVKSVSVQTDLTPAGCPYAIAGTGNLTIDGTVDYYDPAVSLTPSATSFLYGAHVRSNGSISTSSSCPPKLVRGNSSVNTGSTNLTSSCVESPGLPLTLAATDQLVLPGAVCGTCDTVNSNLTGIANGGAVYSDGPKKLNVGAGVTATLQPGIYYFKIVQIAGTLNVNTTTGTVTIYLKPGTFTTTTGCQINNLSKYPSRLTFIDLTTSGHTLDFKCSTPLHAYFEGDFAKTDIQQEVYGHLCSDRVQVYSTGKVHWDGGSLLHATWTLGSAGSWKEGYKRQ